MRMFWQIAVLSVWVVSAVILLCALREVKVLGHRDDLIACERLMRMILVMLSVQMLPDGISNYVK